MSSRRKWFQLSMEKFSLLLTKRGDSPYLSNLPSTPLRTHWINWKISLQFITRTNNIPSIYLYLNITHKKFLIFHYYSERLSPLEWLFEFETLQTSESEWMVVMLGMTEGTIFAGANLFIVSRLRARQIYLSTTNLINSASVNL